MPAVPKSVLFAKFEDGLRQGGWHWLALGSGSSLPRDYRVWRDDESLTLKVYLWTLTPGGANRPIDEWRIQPTGISSFANTTGTLTVILGYEPNRDLFAGFDYQAHSGALGSSSSLQIKEKALDDAIGAGMGVHKKSSAELVFAVRPELIGLYIQQLTALHAATVNPNDLKLLEAMAVDPDAVTPADIDTAVTAPERRRVLRMVLRLLRDSRFRSRVLSAYTHRCATCGVQLDLLDAAHILPVGQPGSTDEVSNGVALCALHHRAYDASLIAFNTAFEIQVSASRLATLSKQNRADGSNAFASGLLPLLHLPKAASERPNPGLIQKANKHRAFAFI